MDVQELMSSPAATCHATDSLSRAALLMWQHDCGTIPVVDADGRPVAMITDRDVCMATLMEGKAPSELLVAKAMSKSVTFCRMYESLTKAEELMRKEQIRRLPIVDDNGHLVGVLSLNDIATREHGANVISFGSDGLGAEAIVTTLAAICERKLPSAAE